MLQSVIDLQTFQLYVEWFLWMETAVKLAVGLEVWFMLPRPLETSIERGL